MWVRSLQVFGPLPRSIAAFGDSLTVSPALPLRSYWTDVLQGHNAAVVNAGVGGGYLTKSGMYGTAVGLRRLADLLAEPNLSDVVMLIGTNDLAIGVTPDVFLSAVSSAAQAARAHHVRFWVATIPPRDGSPWSAAAEQARLVVNTRLRSAWLSAQGGRVIDTDAALRDPAQPNRLLPAFDSGDHVHPNAAGAHQLGITIGVALGLLL
jgi:lysophospholipase L1-like esterase